MTREETLQVFKLMKANYPKSYSGLSDEDVKIQVMTWQEAFQKVPAHLVMSAVKYFIYNDTRSFAPNIAEVRERVKEEVRRYNSNVKALQMPNDTSEEEKEKFYKLMNAVLNGEFANV